METPLPSEIARLVLGYLESEKCMDAAKLFLETSPHLQECRTVISNGRRFSTKVSGMTLTDVVEKLFAINATIQERLSKIADCEQLKHRGGDLLEQLKFVVEETRGQRFLVNINVPSQANPQVCNGSPIISSSTRKRHHSQSNSDRERWKRRKVTVTNSSLQPESPSEQVIDLESVEATPLESLPGHVNLSRRGSGSGSECVGNEKEGNVISLSRQPEDVRNTERKDGKEDNTRNSLRSFEKCTASTSTEELLNYSCAQVQTTPYDTPESESESNDEPIENLSLLTKELLNRTELQERIAENINKAILPTDTSSKEDTSVNVCINGGETAPAANTSIVAELNNAIKSIVKATESDPVFEQFLDEIIGPHAENDSTSLDEQHLEAMPIGGGEEEEEEEEEKEVSPNNDSSSKDCCRTVLLRAADEVPLKHRLRSSSRQQNVRVEDEQRDQNKGESSCALEDQNAAAVLSIISANISNATKEEDPARSEGGKDKGSSEVKLPNVVTGGGSEKENASNEIVVESSETTVESKTKKSSMKRARVAKAKRDSVNEEYAPKQDIVTMPTLIMCSKEEISNILASSSPYPPPTRSSAGTSRFIPIAPKDPNASKDSIVDVLYLKTVNVARKVPLSLPNIFSNAIPGRKSETKGNDKLANASTRITVGNSTVVGSVVPSSGKSIGGESITLYGNESNARTLLDSPNVPTINVEGNVNLSGSGLSPYIKFNCSKSNENPSLSDIDLTPIVHDAQPVAAPSLFPNKQPSTSKSADCEIISKRTPRSLLKSRSKNHRLSLSTPRRRSTHIRALDFNTPIKMSSSSSSSNGRENESSGGQFSVKQYAKSVRRASLFKSPPFSTSTMSTRKLKSSLTVLRSCKAPAVGGDWRKRNAGITNSPETTISSSSSSSSSSSTFENKSRKLVKDTWDADLRRTLQTPTENKRERGKAKKSENPSSSSSLDKDVADKCNSRVSKGKGKGKQQNSAKDARIGEEGREEDKGNATVALNRTHDAAKENAKGSKTAEKEERNDGDSTTNHQRGNILEKKTSTKKYAQLKTIQTNLNKRSIEKQECPMGNNRVSVDPVQCSELAKDSVINIGLQLPELIDLETPRKFLHSTDVPPTPRLLSPSSNTTPFVKNTEDSSRMRSFINTPEFPTTPCIALTPKLSDETTADANAKREVFDTYYKPSSEKSSKLSQSSPVLASCQRANQYVPRDIISSTTNTFQTCVSAKFEITQFEVIKENLPKEEAVKELKISSSSRDSPNSTKLNADCFTKDSIADNVKYPFNTEDSNDSDSSSSSSSSSSASSSSSSSSSCSSSSSSSSSSPTSISLNSAKTNTPEKVAFQSCNEAKEMSKNDTDELERDKQTIEPATTGIHENEFSKKTTDVPRHVDVGADKDLSSPSKLFPMFKTEEQTKSEAKETPVKDETLLNEVDISETPSSSKVGVETLTNLSSKISTMINLEEGKSSKSNQLVSVSNSSGTKKLKQKAKILNIRRVTSNSLITLKPGKPIGRSAIMQSKEKSLRIEEKLEVQLEAKRQRMIAKFREMPKSRGNNIVIRDSIKQRRVFKTTKKLTATSQEKKKKKQSYSYIEEGRSEKRKSEERNTSSTGVSSSEDSSVRHTSTMNPLNANEHSATVGNSTRNHDNNITEIDSKEAVAVILPPNPPDDRVDEHGGARVLVVPKKSVDVRETETTTTNNFDATTDAFNRHEENHANECINKEKKNKSNHKKEITLQDKKGEESSQKKKEYQQVVKNSCSTLLKSKIDLVKRDLFSDEENDQKTSESFSRKSFALKKNVSAEKLRDHLSSDVVEDVALARNNTDPKNLSRVLQCLQLIPTSKQQQDCPLEDEQPCKPEYSRDPPPPPPSSLCLQTNPNVTVSNAVEYHFFYDDNDDNNVPLRKRRRRYSSHELEFQINIVLNDQNCEECVKQMTPTDFEEIFNLPPKSKKRSTRRSPAKNENLPAVLGKTTTLSVKRVVIKPLATSSPLNKTPMQKLKNLGDKESRKRTKTDKDLDATVVKIPKKKLSEIKQQNEKRQHATDPQTLLKNLDLDKFLTSVHGTAS